MQEIKDDLKAIRSDVSDIKVTMAVNTKSLEHHVARTDAAERRLEKVEFVLISGFVITVLGGIIKMFVIG